MTSKDTSHAAVEFLRDTHAAACYENGDHRDEVCTPWSVGADAIERNIALQARAEKAESAARESALQEIASLEQAAEAHASQLKAEAERDELAAAIDSIETSHGLTGNGNLWRFWSKQAVKHCDLRMVAIAERDAPQAEVNMLRAKP